jgi:branched-chain amino acid transport system permease protein
MTQMTHSRLGVTGVTAAAIAAIALPFFVADQYQLHLATLIGAYWILVAGLNLVVGFSGQLSIGHVGLLAIGAYAFAILAGRHDIDPFLATAVAGAIGATCGFLLGLPSLRLPGFYFAMATLAFALIVGELSLAEQDLTGGGAGLAVPGFPAPFDTPSGFYWLVLAVAGVATWVTWNIARLIWGCALIAIRDSEVAARATGVPVFRMKLLVFTFSGFTAGVSGALFASLQTYITPETFTFELGLFFFVAIIIGGRGGILGPFLGLVLLTLLPEVVAPLARLGNFFYGALLLVVVLAVPEGIGHLVGTLRERFRPVKVQKQLLSPDPTRLTAAIQAGKRG